jgi:Ca2+-binding EF-hand superfamily protein
VLSLWKEMTLDDTIETKAIIKAFCDNTSETTDKIYIEDYKFKELLGNIAIYLKASNLTVQGLFKKLDHDGDGIISKSDYFKTIDQVMSLHPTIKEQFFNNFNQGDGILLNTLVQCFSDYDRKITQNKFDIENYVINEFRKWIDGGDTKKLNDYEIFMGIDFNCDGKICIADLKRFLIDVLHVPKADLSYDVVERVIKYLSMGGGANYITLSDFIELSKDIKTGRLRDIHNSMEFKTTCFALKRSEDWVNSTIERIGHYISEQYDSLEQYFERGRGNQAGMNISDFKTWINGNLAFNDGVDISPDEVSILFNTLDKERLGYLTFGNVEKRLSNFDFYKKMHLDIKRFISDNFVDGYTAFRYFINKEEYNEARIEPDDLNSITLTKKELFDGIKDISTNKYKTDTILRYLSKVFVDPENVTYAEFNKVYYDLPSPKKATVNQRIFTGRSREFEKPFFDKKHQAARAFSAKHATSHLNKLSTPFDEDPLEKVKRLINSSKLDYTQYFKLYEMVNGETMNQMEFRNLIKQLNIGLTHLEIDYIISRIIKTGDGKVYYKEFFKFINNQYIKFNHRDKHLGRIETNTKQLLGEIKQLIYKYYSNPRFAFEFVSN